MLRFSLSFAATRQNSEDDLALQPPRDTWSRYKSKTCDFSRNLVWLGECWSGILPWPRLVSSGWFPGSPLSGISSRATGIFLGLFRPPCMTSWPCRVAQRLRCPVPSRPPPARFERRPAGRGGGGGHSRLSWSLPEVRCCRSPCWWSAAAGAAGRCKHKWQGGSRLSSAWSSGQSWNWEKHIWGIFPPQRVPFQGYWKGGWPV